MLYQVETAGEDQELALTRYCESFPYQQDILDYTRLLLSGVRKEQAAIDKRIENASEHWKLGRTTYIDRSILRLAVFEMIFSQDVPLRSQSMRQSSWAKNTETQSQGFYQRSAR